jgi:hypothetical protein
MISAQKQDTRAILIKIASIRFSCIQNTQIRGETIAKVFRKVDTFWTYHPAGSKNKPKMPSATPGPSAPSPDTSSSSPRIYSFFCICNAQCRKIQHLPLKFTKFMDGQELREAVLREHSGGGAPYEVEIRYDGAGEQFFKGGWS